MPTQNEDKIVIGTYAINFSKAGQKWKIGKDADVGSNLPAVASFHENNTLINKGSIYSDDDYGVYFTKNNATLKNKESGHINGGQFGVHFDPTTNADVKGSVVNHGEILGLQAGVLTSGTGDFKLDNYGEISGQVYGVYSLAGNSGSTAGPVIKNAGSITSDTYGVHVFAIPGLRSKIVNQKDGVIEGGKVFDGGAAVHNPNGDMTLINKGKIKGDVTTPNDDTNTITNMGKIKGDVYLGSNDDTFDNTGGKVTGRIVGLDGKDKFIAGDAKDTFMFDGPINGTTNIDRVKNFESGKDTFILEQWEFSGLPAGPLAKSAFRKGTEAKDGDDRIIYDQDSGKLYHDEDGVGGDPHVQFAKVDPGQKLKYSDFTVEMFE
ncbi:hypothetical protein [Bauldia sp.]|uniref:hypothetical protein n=1 Tax=Bauldia sp. TaxID=2575872 RepID=UPI003BAA5EA6